MRRNFKKMVVCFTACALLAGGTSAPIYGESSHMHSAKMTKSKTEEERGLFPEVETKDATCKKNHKEKKPNRKPVVDVETSVAEKPVKDHEPQVEKPNWQGCPTWPDWMENLKEFPMPEWIVKPCEKPVVNVETSAVEKPCKKPHSERPCENPKVVETPAAEKPVVGNGTHTKWPNKPVCTPSSENTEVSEENQEQQVSETSEDNQETPRKKLEKSSKKSKTKRKIKKILLRKNKFVTLSLDRATYYKDTTVAVKDSEGDKVKASILKKTKKQIVLKVTGLEKNEKYSVTVDGVKAKGEKTYSSMSKTFTTK
ncbi:MAG: hypothetical protein ACI4SQ_03615 [Eubacterium sp.]